MKEENSLLVPRGEGIPVYTHLGHHATSITLRQKLRQMKQWKWKWKWKWRGNNVKNGVILCTKKKEEEKIAWLMHFLALEPSDATT